MSKTEKQHITSIFSQEDEIIRKAREESPRLGLPDISINAEEGKFLMLLTAAVGAKKAVEIGTLGGYSGIWIARGLKRGGKLITIDVDEHHSNVARSHFEKAGVLEKIELITGEASKQLENICERGPYDFVFIDADKDGYPAYYEWAVDNIRPGGVITAHNAFSWGDVEPGIKSPGASKMRNFLEMVSQDDRVISSIYPSGDGTLVAVKRL